MFTNQCPSFSIQILKFKMATITRAKTIITSPIRIHSASSSQLPKIITNASSLQPVVRLKLINLHSASSIRIPSNSINKCFYNGPRVVLSPLKNARLGSSKFRHIPFKTHRLYPNITKCNSKRCKCCKYISCNSTIKSSVSGRTFSVKLSVDVT